METSPVSQRTLRAPRPHHPGAIALTLGLSVLMAACQPAPAASPTTAPAKPADVSKPAASPAAPSPAATVPSPAAKPAASPVASPAASPSAGASLPVVQVTARDFAFDMPDTITAGLTSIELRSSGDEPHHVQLLRLNDSVTIEQFTAALAQGEGPALALVSLDGGVGQIVRNGNAESIVNLRPGQYVAICFVPSPDGVPHFVKGMIKPFRVTAAPAVAVPVAAPQVAGTVTMKDFSFDMPTTISPGRTVYRVVNEGPQQLHETNIVRLESGKTLADVTSFITAPAAAGGPPPFTPVGGMQGLSVNGSGFMVTQLQPGSYAAVCFIPDPASGKSHLELGMGKEFAVR